MSLQFRATLNTSLALGHLFGVALVVPEVLTLNSRLCAGRYIVFEGRPSNVAPKPFANRLGKRLCHAPYSAYSKLDVAWMHLAGLRNALYMDAGHATGDMSPISVITELLKHVIQPQLL